MAIPNNADDFIDDLLGDSWTEETQVTDADTLNFNKINEMRLTKKRSHTMTTRSMSNSMSKFKKIRAKRVKKTE
jgi:hypothetical protein